ncbi:non-homologous end-joining DNA ligase [Streptomyces cocklensis]|jgi:bifunctional non-homologous end joining protein LigD|uniref:Bifunctional non-homologous end joining protein LigD n=1 Tax=Actinacidiphila cocklensis TaxID=887465 RepID=A0A9W4E9T6_9ACTN|nr:non-homologous end-joining DNA ligase [Actinacidiphila cocklensis]MDD1063793.1 non-homologous end-joining DNA ligase [Actinacidiphila cocklensis]WSX73044.1 non-homologous end-joining DNA ligase [Streptomyces sp. NBC_00899]WSX80890.1 non-homologous end-joining DNA ligase [Streptomyces sp. NBC_00899]CAG6396613.1 Bifunctional non-homologous end joining protein LigD [Actinacidiphila cocklensis]
MPITEVEGRQIKLSHLDRVLWPETGTTKGELLHYYASVAEVLIPHCAGRPVSFVRTPDGVQGQRFFQKRPPAGTPEWVTTAETLRSSGELMPQVQINDLATLMWAANLACVEIHTPQWRSAAPGTADRLVVDLDPGPGRTVVDCCEVALLLRERLAADGIRTWAKTSGSKGLHLYAALRGADSREASAYARRVAQELERGYPERVVSRMAKADRTGRVFIDWSQNSAKKTTATPYTVRARPHPTVSTPLAWSEVAAARTPSDLTFALADLPPRLTAHGDLLAALLTPEAAAPLPPHGG